VEDVSEEEVEEEDEEDAQAGRLAAFWKCLPSAASNFAIQYNYQCMSLAAAIMSSHDDVLQTYDGREVAPDFPEPLWVADTLQSIVFIGSVVGMLTMGYLGDKIGIQPALIITNLLTVAGALASTLCSWGSSQTVWVVIYASRFILGTGVGGAYPLSAANAAEAAPSAREAVAKAGNAFFWQAPGCLAPAVIGLLLLDMPRSGAATSIQFRLLLGLGAVPACVVLYAELRKHQQESSKSVPPIGKREQQPSTVLEAKAGPQKAYLWTLLGTAGTWFFFDVAFYGTVMFAPSILTNIFGSQQSLRDIFQRATFLGVIAVVGTAVGIMVLPRVGAKLLNTVGLLCAAALFAAFLLIHTFRRDWQMTSFALLCALYFAFYSSSNIATYVLPVIHFPRAVRSTYHGLSSSAAKLGAMSGSLLFPIIFSRLGVGAVVAVQCAMCLFGAASCHFFLENKGLEVDDDECECAVFPDAIDYTADRAAGE
jgi:MFS family permease